MRLPLPILVGDFRSDLDQTLEQLFHWPLDLFTHEVVFPEHVKEVVGQDSHEKASPIGGIALL